MKIELNKASLTLGDLEDFEDKAGQSLSRIMSVFEEAGSDGIAGLPMRTILTLIWIAGRKSDPNLTYEDVRGINLDELEELEVEVVDGADPTTGSK